MLFLVWRADEEALDAVAREFGRFRAGDPDHGMVEGAALPPGWILAGEVHGDLGGAGHCLSDLVGCDEEDFALLCVVEFELPGVGLVVFEFVSGSSVLEKLRRGQPLLQ